MAKKKKPRVFSKYHSTSSVIVPVIILQTTPRQPALMDTAYAAPSGSTLVVGDGGNFQTALNDAEPGDTITLAAATYTGNFTLPAKSGSEYIHVRPAASLTTEGTRVTTGQLAGFPKIVTANANQAIQADAGASYYRFINCDIKSGSTFTNIGLVRLGSGVETDVDDFPHHIILDRCGVRGHVDNGGRRGVLFSGDYQAVIDSYLSDWKEVGFDSQAICGWTGRGPYKVANNYLEGAGENVMFGGADSQIADVIPSDIEIRGNYFFKPLTWKIGHESYLGTAWSVKNILEFKSARRILVIDNEFENCWTHGQTGNAIVINPINQGGSAPWTTVCDLTFKSNQLHGVEEVFRISGGDETQGAVQKARRLLLSRNLMYDVTGLDQFLYILGGGVDLVIIDHNTANNLGHILSVADQPLSVFQYTNNIASHGVYGFKGDNQNSGNGTINHYLPGALIEKNVIVLDPANPQGLTSSDYPAQNFFPEEMADVGFVTLAGNVDLRLTEASAYHNAALDGTDIGANLETPA